MHKIIELLLKDIQQRIVWLISTSLIGWLLVHAPATYPFDFDKILTKEQQVTALAVSLILVLTLISSLIILKLKYRVRKEDYNFDEHRHYYSHKTKGGKYCAKCFPEHLSDLGVHNSEYGIYRCPKCSQLAPN